MNLQAELAEIEAQAHAVAQEMQSIQQRGMQLQNQMAELQGQAKLIFKLDPTLAAQSGNLSDAPAPAAEVLLDVVHADLPVDPAPATPEPAADETPAPETDAPVEPQEAAPAPEAAPTAEEEAAPAAEPELPPAEPAVEAPAPEHQPDPSVDVSVG